ncbi:MAG: hypothetical protein O3C43_06895 [Verrucomicrobia bacterium]|nr:hypothetical protein [Verrucomicrobiota bacterium]MDA1066214.1 hypothetical protein [Verrucomicrobiota bacterium]
MPDNEDGMLITLSEDQGVYSGTFRGEGEVHQVACKLEDGLLVGTILGKPLHITMFQDGPYLELTLVGMTWGALIDQSTARTYVLTLQGETSSAAANYVQSTLAGEQTVIFNGQILSRRQLEDFFKQYQRYPRPGSYWYDPNSGLYGAIGYDAFGYMRKGHDYGPLQSNVSRGDSRLYVNGRCLSKREARVWGQLMGQELGPGNYIFDERGSFSIEGNRGSQWNLFDLAEKNTSGFHEDLESKHWTSRFGRGRRGERDWDEFISVPGFGPADYGFVEPEEAP